VLIRGIISASNGRWQSYSDSNVPDREKNAADLAGLGPVAAAGFPAISAQMPRWPLRIRWTTPGGGLPKTLNRIYIQRRINTDEGYFLDQRLRDQQPVEWVSMVKRKGNQCGRMAGQNRQERESLAGN
jgi:hypothetical protein